MAPHDWLRFSGVAGQKSGEMRTAILGPGADMDRIQRTNALAKLFGTELIGTITAGELIRAHSVVHVERVERAS